MCDYRVTMCMTIGRRPDLLQQTMHSLAGLPAMPVIAINDFGDPETNAAFAAACPTGKLIDLGRKVGHHPAVDELYRQVTTPYILHNEDDWGFSRVEFLDAACRLLEIDQKISVVCLRDTDDMPLTATERARIRVEEQAGVRYQLLDDLHKQWHGFTFNPHLTRKAMWEGLGGYSSFKKERHISRDLRSKGFHVAFILPPACKHIGDGRSTHLKPPSRFKKFKNWVRGR